jgi:hypothetical protein
MVMTFGHQIAFKKILVCEKLACFAVGVINTHSLTDLIANICYLCYFIKKLPGLIFSNFEKMTHVGPRPNVLALEKGRPSCVLNATE